MSESIRADNQTLEAMGHRGDGGNLARSPGGLIGRGRALEALNTALDRSPLVTLVGPGGIGKTRMALAAAHCRRDRYPDGVWLIELAGVGSSQDVATVVADVFAVGPRPGVSPVASIAAALEHRRLLLVLDNCEHVVDGVAAVARGVNRSCRGATVLATSREGLGTVDEHLLAVTPLDPSGAAIELFNERARAVAADFDRDANRQVVEEICRRLDGVPLAIELAAARVADLEPAELVVRLDDRLRLLTGGRRTSMERHRTLRATIQWSYDLLSPAERCVFRQLSIFTGPFDLAAVEAVVAVDDGTATAVDVLVDQLAEQAMVVVEPGPFGSRMRLLEPMRHYGAECLQALGKTDEVAERHVGWCLERVVAIAGQFADQAEPEAMAGLSELMPNLRTAFDWAMAVDDRVLATRLVGPIRAEAAIHNRSEIGEWARRILDASPGRHRTL